VTEPGVYLRSVAEASPPSAALTPEAHLRALVGADPSTTALFFDFDGTLAPIVEDPAAATAVDGALDLLEGLARRFRRVAVVSGRPRAFLVERVGPDVDLSGVYGLETRVDGEVRDHHDAGRWRAVVAEVAGSGEEALPTGVLVESKGLSLTVHYREAPEAEAAVLRWARQAAAGSGLELRSAKRSVELHPPLAVDKGTSVLELSEGCATVAYLGDDVGDLPAFAALDRLAADGVTTCKVAITSDELHDDVAAAADLLLDGPAAVVAALAPLVEPGA
jgi:trehalose 6-phosphate phosphatase